MALPVVVFIITTPFPFGRPSSCLTTSGPRFGSGCDSGPDEPLDCNRLLVINLQSIDLLIINSHLIFRIVAREARMSKAPVRLGKVQLEIMEVLWRHGRATARQITDELSRARPIAHSTVQTLLRQLEAKGAVTHEVEERTFVFRPLCQPADLTTSALRDLLTRAFHGSVYGLVAHLFEHETIPPHERQQLRELIEKESQRSDAPA
jgi:BlaI family transcriptional regulator, penicillinase repressor